MGKKTGINSHLQGKPVVELLNKWEHKEGPELEHMEFKGQVYVLEKQGNKRRLYRVLASK